MFAFALVCSLARLVLISHAATLSIHVFGVHNQSQYYSKGLDKQDSSLLSFQSRNFSKSRESLSTAKENDMPAASLHLSANTVTAMHRNGALIIIFHGDEDLAKDAIIYPDAKLFANHPPGSKSDAVNGKIDVQDKDAFLMILPSPYSYAWKSHISKLRLHDLHGTFTSLETSPEAAKLWFANLVEFMGMKGLGGSTLVAGRFVSRFVNVRAGKSSPFSNPTFDFVNLHTWNRSQPGIVGDGAGTNKISWEMGNSKCKLDLGMLEVNHLKLQYSGNVIVAIYRKSSSQLIYSNLNTQIVSTHSPMSEIEGIQPINLSVQPDDFILILIPLNPAWMMRQTEFFDLLTQLSNSPHADLDSVFETFVETNISDSNQVFLMICSIGSTKVAQHPSHQTDITTTSSLLPAIDISNHHEAIDLCNYDTGSNEAIGNLAADAISISSSTDDLKRPMPRLLSSTRLPPRTSTKRPREGNPYHRYEPPPKRMRRQQSETFHFIDADTGKEEVVVIIPDSDSEE